MHYKAEVVERDGKLYILEYWQNDFSKPVQRRIAWPTGLYTQDCPSCVGQLAKPFSGGRYKLSDGLILQLEDGRKTLPSEEYSEERAIPKPPGYHEYSNGRWIR